MTSAPDGSPHVRYRVGVGSDLDANLNLRVSSRYSRDLVARRDLERYYAILVRERPQFTRAEALAIIDATNGTLFDGYSARLLWADIEDSDGLAQKWSIDQAALVAKLRGLSYAQGMAVVDGIERFWSYGTGAAEGADTDAALVACGLVSADSLP